MIFEVESVELNMSKLPNSILQNLNILESQKLFNILIVSWIRGT